MAIISDIIVYSLYKSFGLRTLTAPFTALVSLDSEDLTLPIPNTGFNNCYRLADLIVQLIT